MKSFFVPVRTAFMTQEEECIRFIARDSFKRLGFVSDLVTGPCLCVPDILVKKTGNRQYFINKNDLES